MSHRAAAVLLVAGLVSGVPAAAQPILFSEEDPSGCYAFEGTERLRGGIEFPEQVAPVWFFVCPFGQRPLLERPDPEAKSPLQVVLEDLAKDARDPEAAWWAGQLATWDPRTLHGNLCKVVAYSRSIEKFQGDPKPGRNRSAKEIQAYLLDLTGPGRPPEVQRFRPIVQSWKPRTLKAWHDGAKKVWPVIARVACPELEP